MYGFDKKDTGLLSKEYVPEAMKLYSTAVEELIRNKDNINIEEYIKEVSKLHFRFIRIHPFPDGNGRTARAISNMLLLEKGMIAVFEKDNKKEYIDKLALLNDTGKDETYKKALYTDQTICSDMEENNYVLYKIEEFIGLKCIEENNNLYSDRDITTELVLETR